MVRIARDGAHEEELVKHDLPVVEVSFGQAVDRFKVKRGEYLARNNQRFKIGEMLR